MRQKHRKHYSLFNGNFFAGVGDGGEDDAAVRAVSKLLDKRVTIHDVTRLLTAADDRSVYKITTTT